MLKREYTGEETQRLLHTSVAVNSSIFRPVPYLEVLSILEGNKLAFLTISHSSISKEKE